MLPGPDEFDELALREGVVCRALAYPERFFSASARQAGWLFPTWAAYQRECLDRSANLRRDFEGMVAEAGEV